MCVPSASHDRAVMRGSKSGRIGVDTVRQICFVTTGTRGVPLFCVSRKWGMNDTLVTPWVISG